MFDAAGSDAELLPGGVPRGKDPCSAAVAADPAVAGPDTAVVDADVMGSVAAAGVAVLLPSVSAGAFSSSCLHHSNLQGTKKTISQREKARQR